MNFVVKCGVRRLKVVCSRQEVGVFGSARRQCAKSPYLIRRQNMV